MESRPRSSARRRARRPCVQRLPVVGAARADRSDLPVVPRQRPDDDDRRDAVRPAHADRKPAEQPRDSPRGAALRSDVRDLGSALPDDPRCGTGARAGDARLLPHLSRRADLAAVRARPRGAAAPPFAGGCRCSRTRSSRSAIPWVLLARAETRLTSSLTGLLLRQCRWSARSSSVSPEPANDRVGGGGSGCSSGSSESRRSSGSTWGRSTPPHWSRCSPSRSVTRSGRSSSRAG